MSDCEHDWRHGDSSCCDECPPGDVFVICLDCGELLEWGTPEYYDIMKWMGVLLLPEEVTFP